MLDGAEMQAAEEMRRQEVGSVVVLERYLLASYGACTSARRASVAERGRRAA